MNYDDMSDFEINKAVAKSLGVTVPKKMNPWLLIAGNTIIEMNEDGSRIKSVLVKDYCNNPTDMWPIIVDNGVTIAKHVNLDFWECFGGGYQVNYDHEIESCDDAECSHSNPLRAAAIVFLKMQNAS